MKLITVEAKGNGAVEIRIGGRKLNAFNSDCAEAKSLDPLPVEMLCVSLGTCICLMVDAFCRRNSYTDGNVLLSLTYQMGGTPKKIVVITLDIELPKDLPPVKRKAVLKIAQSCPIHATLSHAPQIDIDIVS
jgi:putative redox protein